MSLFGNRPDPDRIARLAQLEKQIEPGLRAEQTFAAAGQALAAVRDERLYSHKWPTFAAYLEARWQIKERHAIRLIDAAAALKDLAELAPLAPTERHARILTHVPPEHRQEVLRDSLSHVGQENAAPSLEALELAAEPYRKRRKVAKRKKPANVVLKGKGWRVVIERRTHAITPHDALRLASEIVAERERKAA